MVEAVDDARRVTLGGNIHPLARADFDRGPVADSLPMNRILLLLKRSDEQETSLEDFLQRLQDKSFADFHHWLTPEQFGAQFGPADRDIQAVTDWLVQITSLILGVHQLTAKYSGDANNLPSTSASISQTITGSVSQWIQGQTGGDLHSIPVTIGIQ